MDAEPANFPDSTGRHAVCCVAGGDECRRATRKTPRHALNELRHAVEGPRGTENTASQ